MQVRRLFVLILAVAAAAVAGLDTVTAQKGAKAPKIAKLSMATGGALRVFGDGLGPYIDYRSVTATPSDYCVEISADSTFVRLNRPIGDLNCADPAPPVRNFWLQIDNATACGHFDPDTNPNADWTDATQTSCRVSGHERPRIRALDVFKSRVSKIPVAFLILNYDDSYSFEVRTNVDAAVTASGAARIVTYGGNVTLWKFHPFPQQATPEVSFPMPFQLIFEQLAS
jgi:hypothetical protein